MLNNGDSMLHMMGYVLKSKIKYRYAIFVLKSRHKNHHDETVLHGWQKMLKITIERENGLMVVLTKKHEPSVQYKGIISKEQTISKIPKLV